MICAVLEPEVIETVGGAFSPLTIPEIPCFSTISMQDVAARVVPL